MESEIWDPENGMWNHLGGARFARATQAHINNTTDENQLSNNYSIDIDENIYSPIQDTVIIQNNMHFANMKILQEKELANTICDNDYKDCLELVSILMKNKIPVSNMYNDTMKWKNKDKKLTSTKMTIKSLLSCAEARVYGSSIATKIKPTQTNLICPSGRHVTITTFDADALIYDMLRLAGADIQKQTFSKVCFSNFKVQTS